MYLRLKLTSEICQKVGSLGEKKTRTKQSQSAHLTTFFSKKKQLHLLKNKKLLSIFYCKDKCTYKFYVLTIKSPFGSMPKIIEFRFENSLKNRYLYSVKY